MRRALLLGCLFGALAGEAAAHPPPMALLERAVGIEQQLVASGRGASQQTDRLQLYVGDALPDWSLLEIKLTVVDGTTRRYSYSPAQQRAFAGGGLHRFATLDAATQPRRAWIEYFIRERDSGRAVQPLRGRLELELAPGAGMLGLQLQERTLGKPQLGSVGTLDVAGAIARHARFLELSGHASRAAFLRGETASLNLPQVTLPAPSLHAANPVALAALAESEPASGIDWAVRDQANLRLGYQQLRNGQPAQAAEAFRRVRSPGPYANAALLGYGWARLIPTQAPQAAAMFVGDASLRPRGDDEVAETRRTTPFRYAAAIAHDNRADDLHSALVPWGELIGRDPTDPAVEEGLIALAYAHGHLGAHEQATRYFRRSVDQLDAVIAHYDAARRDIGGGGLARLWTQVTNSDDGWPGWMAAMPEPRWWLTDPPNAPATFYFDGLIADAAFLRELDELLGVRELQELLAEQAIRADGTALREANARLGTECAAQDAALQNALQQRALRHIDAQRRQAEQYLAEASFALARMVDRETAFADGALP